MKLKISRLNLETTLYITFILFALLTRFWDLGARTMSFDEGLHTYYSWTLATGRGYIHNPMIHGPFLFHANALVFLLLGANDFTARVLPALFGVVLTGLPFFLRRWMGKTGALAASGLIALSPSFLYFSRYLRNDIYIAVWSMLMLIALFNYLEDRKQKWIYLGAGAFALSICTKEVAFFHGFIFLSFIFLAAFRSKTVRLALRKIKLKTVIVSLVMTGLLFITLYTTLFTNPAGLESGTTGAVKHWLSRHPVKLGGHPWFYYVFMMLSYEFLPLVFSLLAAGWAVLRLIQRKQDSLFTYFLFYWTGLAWIIYSLAGERMPWLMLHILLPIVLLAGQFIGQLYKRAPRSLFIVVLLILAVLTLQISWQVNYLDYADSIEPMAFAQGSPEIRVAVQKIDEAARGSGQGKRIKIVCDKYLAWPFAWYLREYNDQVHYGDYTNVKKHEITAVIVADENEAAVKPLLKKKYRRYEYRLFSWPLAFHRFGIASRNKQKVQHFTLYLLE